MVSTYDSPILSQILSVCKQSSIVNLFVGFYLGYAESGEGGTSRKRGSSGSRNMSLQLVYKSGGEEHKIIFTPIQTHRKQAVEWLRGLKKVHLGEPAQLAT